MVTINWFKNKPIVDKILTQGPSVKFFCLAFAFTVSMVLALPISHLELGNEAFNQQQYSKALAHYRKALSEGENRPMALFNMGNSLYLLKQEGRALSLYEQAIREAPDFIRPYLNAGGIYFKFDQMGLALTRYHRALELDSSNVNVLKMLGECYIKIGDRSQALYYLDIGRRLEPENLDWYYAMVEIFVKMEDMHSAEKILQEALSTTIESSAIYFYLAELFQSEGEKTQAIGAYIHGMELEPTNARAPFQLASLHEEMGNPFLGLSVLKEASLQKPLQKECYLEMGRLYFSLGQFSVAVDSYAEAAKLGEIHALGGLLNVAKRVYNQGEKVQAREIFKRIQILFPNDPEVSQTLKDLGA